MSLGTGIAIAGVWVSSGLMGYCDSITDVGFAVGILISLCVTIGLVTCTY